MTNESAYSRRYLLAPRSTEDEVATVAARLNWERLGEILEDSANLVSHEVIWGRDEKLTLHYSEDLLSRSPHAFVTGDDQAKVDIVSRIVEQKLRPATLEEILEAADDVAGNIPDEMLAVLRLGLGAPLSFDERFFLRIRDAMQSSIFQLRKAAIWATSYVPWPQYIPLLVEVAEHDPIESLRSDARMLLEAYKSQGIGGGS
jgi:hypothetical protein